MLGEAKTRLKLLIDIVLVQPRGGPNAWAVRWAASLFCLRCIGTMFNFARWNVECIAH